MSKTDFDNKLIRFNRKITSNKTKYLEVLKNQSNSTAFLHSIKLSVYGIRIKFDEDPLAIEQNNYLTKIVNIYIVYDLDAWPRNLTNNFKFQNCSFGATREVKNSDKEKYVYSGYRIKFNCTGP